MILTTDMLKKLAKNSVKPGTAGEDSTSWRLDFKSAGEEIDALVNYLSGQRRNYQVSARLTKLLDQVGRVYQLKKNKLDYVNASSTDLGVDSAYIARLCRFWRHEEAAGFRQENTRDKNRIQLFGTQEPASWDEGKVVDFIAQGDSNVTMVVDRII